MKLKALFYPKVMFIENALKIYVIESTLKNAKSENLVLFFHVQIRMLNCIHRRHCTSQVILYQNNIIMCNRISKIFKLIYNIFCYFPICIKIYKFDHMVYYSYELRWASSDNTLKELDASGSFFIALSIIF